MYGECPEISKERLDKRIAGVRASRVKAKAKGYFANVTNRWDSMREDFFDHTIARTKCCGISLHGRRAEIDIFIASGIKPKHRSTR